MTVAITRARSVKVASLAEASRVCRAYLERSGAGSSGWSGGEVRDESWEVVARVSFNGRVWPPGAWTPSVKPLFDPKAVA